MRKHTVKGTPQRVVVLGAGITGTSVALSLGARGMPVTLIEQDQTPMNRASLRNEGKIHLGLIYANDPSLATARLQLRGALQFRALLRRWIGARADALSRSTAFFYLVARDSVLSPDRLRQHYCFVEDLYRDFIAADPSLDYFGERPERLLERCPLCTLKDIFQVSRFSAAYRTAEIAIDTDELAAVLRSAISESSQVTFLPRRKVLGIARANGQFNVDGVGPEGTWQLSADQVVNAMWENRIHFDQMLGVDCPKGWLHRLKYRVIARLPEKFSGAPSATVVLGPYGDVVVRNNGTAYLSWYPIGLQGWTHASAPPASWEAPCRGDVDRESSQAMARGILQAIDAWYPGIGKARPILVDAGAIVAYGKTDVGDASSGLHARTHIGVTSVEGYHSVDPGKLTTAPLFAEEAAYRVCNLKSE
jgi:glycine/D-amino acid oxidase-like deaminating enzyme